VVFLSAINRDMGMSFGPREIGQYLGAEPAAFLEKPVQPERLLRIVTEVTERQAGRAGEAEGGTPSASRPRGGNRLTEQTGSR
jgi:hypothetical protein